jgi:hypothetical protein
MSLPIWITSGVGYVAALYLLAILFGIVMRFVMGRVRRGSVHGLRRNLSAHDRSVRLTLGVALLAIAAVTNWGPVTVFFSGFCFYEAVASWCGFYALAGKTTCAA